MREIQSARRGIKRRVFELVEGCDDELSVLNCDDDDDDGDVVSLLAVCEEVRIFADDDVSASADIFISSMLCFSSREFVLRPFSFFSSSSVLCIFGGDCPCSICDSVAVMLFVSPLSSSSLSSPFR